MATKKKTETALTYRRGAPLSDLEKREIVLQKMTTRRTDSEIAEAVGRSRKCVNGVRYEDLSPKDQALIDAQLAKIERRMIRLRYKAMDKAEAMVELIPDDEFDRLPAVVGAMKIADDIVRKIQGTPTEIVEHRNNAVTVELLALKSVNNLVEKGWEPEDALRGVAERFEVDHTRLTEAYENQGEK